MGLPGAAEENLQVPCNASKGREASRAPLRDVMWSLLTRAGQIVRHLLLLLLPLLRHERGVSSHFARNCKNQHEDL